MKHVYETPDRKENMFLIYFFGIFYIEFLLSLTFRARARAQAHSSIDVSIADTENVEKTKQTDAAIFVRWTKKTFNNFRLFAQLNRATVVWLHNVVIVCVCMCAMMMRECDTCPKLDTIHKPIYVSIPSTMDTWIKTKFLHFLKQNRNIWTRRSIDAIDAKNFAHVLTTATQFHWNAEKQVSILIHLLVQACAFRNICARNRQRRGWCDRNN